MVEELYNVYAWREFEEGSLVGKSLPYEEAVKIFDSYFNRGDNWDAYIVKVNEDYLMMLQKGKVMTMLEVLKEKRNRLLQNGKNTEGQGVIRKLDRKIRNLERTR